MIPEALNDILSQTFTDIFNDIVPDLLQVFSNDKVNFFLQGFNLYVPNQAYRYTGSILRQNIKAGDYPIHSLTIDQPDIITINNARVVKNTLSSLLPINILVDWQKNSVPIIYYSKNSGVVQVIIDNYTVSVMNDVNYYSFSLRVESKLKDNVDQVIEYIETKDYESINDLKNIFDKFKNLPSSKSIEASSSSSSSNVFIENLPFIYKDSIKDNENIATRYFSFEIDKNTNNKQTIICNLENNIKLSFDLFILEEFNNVTFICEDGNFFNLNSKYALVEKNNKEYLCEFKSIYRLVNEQPNLENLFTKYFLVITG